MNFVTNVFKKYIQIEPQETTEHESTKQPEPVADGKENGFPHKLSKPSGSGVGCGSAKPKPSQPRRSVLKIFDPLYEDSPEKAPEPKIREQLIVEDFDESGSSQILHSEVVSDDDESSFLDAFTATDEASTEKVTPQVKVVEEEELLLKFDTPEKIYVTEERSNVSEDKPVLQSPQPSTSAIHEPEIETETIFAVSSQLSITESEIVDKISRKLTRGCDIIPTRSKFTITQSELENYNILKRLSRDRRDDNIVPIQYVAHSVETDPLTVPTSDVEIIPPDAPEDVQQAENLIGNQSAEKKESSDNNQESNSVTEQRSATDVECVTADISEETVEVVNESRIEEPSTSKEAGSSESPKFIEENKDIEILPEKEEESPRQTKLNPENILKTCQELLDRESISEFETQNIEKEASVIESSELQIEEEKAEVKCKNQDIIQASLPEEPEPQIKEVEESQSEGPHSLKLEEKSVEEPQPVEEQTSEEICEKSEATQPDSHSETESKLEKVLENSEPDCKVEPEHQKSDLESEGEVRSGFEQKSEELQAELVPDPETSHSTLDDIEHKQLESVCEAEVLTDQDSVNSQGSNFAELDSFQSFDKPEVELISHGVIKDSETNKELKPAEIEGEIKCASPESEPSLIAEAVPERKTEKLVELPSEPEEKCDVITEVTPDPNATYICHDDELHLDSGVDSIEELYTKSPKSQKDLEESNKGEDQNLEQDDSCLPGEELSDEVDQSKEPVAQEESNEESKIKDFLQDEASCATPSLEQKTASVNEPGESEVVEAATNLPDRQKFDKQSSTDFESCQAKMADLSEKLSEQQQENSDLKLQLNASQQANASLELEIRQKEEVIIKTQAEALKNEQIFKQEIKQLREKLKENSKLIEKDGSKELEDQLKEAKAREAKAVAELNQKTKDDLNYQKIMEEYENTISTSFADYQKLKEEHETATRHLANIELAFSDVHQKYERTKALLEGFKSNEEALNAALQASEKTCKQHEERYESLKAHAKGQIEKSNKEIITLRDKYEMDINKLKAIIKRLEIKCSSLEVSLQQKTEECAALAALCDEVTGKKV